MAGSFSRSFWCALMIIGAVSYTCLRAGEQKRMQDIPIAVREFLSASDGLGKMAVREQHPNLDQQLADPNTRVTILRFLESDEAWEEKDSGFVASCIEFLMAKAKTEEVPIIRTFLLSAEPHVRLRAYEFLVRFAFPDKNRDSLLILLQGMLSDEDDMVRTQGAHFIERADAVSPLLPFLQRWMKIAANKAWTESESFELVEHMIHKATRRPRL
jgi:hypothetical protein